MWPWFNCRAFGLLTNHKCSSVSPVFQWLALRSGHFPEESYVRMKMSVLVAMEPFPAIPPGKMSVSGTSKKWHENLIHSEWVGVLMMFVAGERYKHKQIYRYKTNKLVSAADSIRYVLVTASSTQAPPLARMWTCLCERHVWKMPGPN